MAGMPGFAVATRAGVMVASLAVIVLMGGRALLLDSSPVSETAPLRPSASTPVRTASTSPKPTASPSGSAAAPTAGVTSDPFSGTGAAAPTGLLLQKVTVPGTHPKRGRITLRAELTDPTTAQPVEGAVTLWRRTAEGHWKAILSDRATSAAGVVLLDVVQSAGRSVYRVSFAPDGKHAAATSAAITVRR